MIPTSGPTLARRIDAVAFAVAMLAFCWWLHAAVGVLAWLARRQPGGPLVLVAVEVFAVALVALGVPVLVGRLLFRLIRVSLRGCLAAAARLHRLSRRGRKGPVGVVSGGAR
jgi:hypothetical protein